jgi:suppressor for copper-sensitivity B
MRELMRQFGLSALIIVASLVTAPGMRAQTSSDDSNPRSHYTDGVIGQFDDSATDLLAESVTVSAKFTAADGKRPAVLFITAKIARGRHTYALTQPRDPRGGPLPTTIELQQSSNYRLLTGFRSQPAPKTRSEELSPGVSVKAEEHEGQVTWYAPIEITAGVDPKSLEVRGTVHMLTCPEGRGTCEPADKEFAARHAASPDVKINLPASPTESATRDPQSTIGNYQADGSGVTIEGKLQPSSVRPGESADIYLTATPAPGAHIYTHADRDDKPGTKPTLIAIQTATGLVPHRATTDAPIKIENSPVFGPLPNHDGPVTWKLRLDVPKNARPGDYPVSGLMGYESCGPQGCELPHAVRFTATLKVGDAPSQSATPLTFAPGGRYPQVAEVAAVFANFVSGKPTEPPQSTAVEKKEPQRPGMRATDQYELNRVILTESTGGSLSYYIALAFVGGMILNLMPCVLPVIGLKVMSFVEQSGKSRGRALVLNLWFAAGIVAVFLVLGLLGSLPQIGLGEKALGWGGQFGSTAFNVTIAVIVFAMALSLLGVWEIPIPGFFGTGSVQSAAAKEGPLGAFLKGVVTTVLATPCTAPFMASAIAWAVTQPVATTLSVFTSLGLGMASPYVLVGVYPELLRFLPKPGPWMETFKQITGFILLGTVIFILSYIETLAVAPTLVLLLGVGIACWYLSWTPLTAEFTQRLKSWAVAGVIVVAFVGLSFKLLYQPATTTWQPFSLERLKQVAVNEGRTVLVDFSADWCLNCKVYERTVLHTKPVEQAIARSGAVTMYGDYTKFPPEIAQTIKALGANGVPVIAIFPGDEPYKPIVFRGSYWQRDLVAALERAKSRNSTPGGNSIVESTAAASP